MSYSVRPLERATTIGFVILSYSQNPMLARLLSRLNQLYREPPIVIHHDYSQAPLPVLEAQLTRNVSVLRPYLLTRWGGFSVVEACLAAIEELYRKHSPDWVANLTASCYPVASGLSVLSELGETPYDAFLGTALLFPQRRVPDPSSIQSVGEILLSPSLPTHVSDISTWMNACYQRYVATESSGSLFGPGFGCFAGDEFFTVNARAASVLIAARHTYPALVHHYSSVHAPDESFYQTVLCNQPGLQISECNRRFANWHTPGAHPLDLTLSDFQRIVDSRCFFARKMSSEASGDLMDALDNLWLTQSGVFAVSDFCPPLDPGIR